MLTCDNDDVLRFITHRLVVSWDDKENITMIPHAC